MSYDLYLFPPKDDEDPQETIERIFEIEESEEDAGTAPLPAGARQLAEDLSRTFPQLEHSGDDNSIELNWDKYGLQVCFFPRYVVVTVAYWDQPRSFAPDAKRIVSHITQKAGYVIYDQQTGQVTQALDSVCAANTVQQVRRRLQEEVAPKKWWQFWR